MGAALLHKSMGAAPLLKSMGAASQGAAPCTNQWMLFWALGDAQCAVTPAPPDQMVPPRPPDQTCSAPPPDQMVPPPPLSTSWIRQPARSVNLNSLALSSYSQPRSPANPGASMGAHRFDVRLLRSMSHPPPCCRRRAGFTPEATHESELRQPRPGQASLASRLGCVYPDTCSWVEGAGCVVHASCTSQCCFAVCVLKRDTPLTV